MKTKDDFSPFVLRLVRYIRDGQLPSVDSEFFGLEGDGWSASWLKEDCYPLFHAGILEYDEDGVPALTPYGRIFAEQL